MPIMNSSVVTFTCQGFSSKFEAIADEQKRDCEREVEMDCDVERKRKRRMLVKAECAAGMQENREAEKRVVKRMQIQLSPQQKWNPRQWNEEHRRGVIGGNFREDAEQHDRHRRYTANAANVLHTVEPVASSMPSAHFASSAASSGSYAQCNSACRATGANVLSSSFFP